MNNKLILYFLIYFFTTDSAINAQEPIGHVNRTGKQALKLSYSAYKKKAYFTSASYMKLYIMQDGEVTQQAAKLIDNILVKSNVFPFLDIPTEILSSINYSKNINFVVAKKYLFKKDYANASLYFRKIKSDSFFYLSSLHQLAGLYQILGNQEEAKSFTDKCLVEAKKKRYKNTESLAFDKLEYIKDSCQSFKARLAYKFSTDKKVTSSFKKIPLNSYYFPQYLLESSWAHYAERDFARSIGKNLSLLSPMMSDYYLPEAELVKTLSYLDLCRYEEGISVIRFFDESAKAKVSNFIKEFNLNQNQRYPFAKLFTDTELRAKLGDTFFNRLLDVIQTKPGFLTIKYYLARLNQEKVVIEATGSDFDKKAFAVAYRDFLEFFNDFVKLKFVKMAKSIIKINNIFTEIELNIYATIKYQLYDKKNKTETVKQRPKFSVKEINRQPNQQHWDFDGEFWADELGSYIPVMDSLCDKQPLSEKTILK
jgi:hypothetical protein